MDNTQSKANWIQAIEVDDDHKLYVSDKGAVKLVQLTVTGERFVACFKPDQIKAMRNIDFNALFDSPEYQAVIKAKEDAKAQRYMNKQLDTQVKRATLQLQAQVEKLQALGVEIKLPTKQS